MRYPLTKMFITPKIKDTFSLALITFVSFHRFPSLSTRRCICLRYRSSCSSASGTRRLHSSTMRSRADCVLVLIASLERLTLSVCAEMPFCSFSSCWGRAKLSRRSSTDRRSRGGRPSQSSWLELLPEKDGFLECIEPLGVVAPSIGVSRRAESAGGLFGEEGAS